MPLVRDQVPLLTDGISQQPVEYRSKGHLEAMTNSWCDPSIGLTTKPPAEFISKLATLGVGDDYFIHFINRDPDNQYIMALKDSSLRVFTLDGTECTISKDPGIETGYLDSADPEDYSAVSVADTTFIANRAHVPLMFLLPSTQPDTPAGFAYAKAISPFTEYKINVTLDYEGGTPLNTSFTVTTGDLSSSDPARSVDNLMKQFATTINAHAHLLSTSTGSSLLIQINSGTYTRINRIWVEDGGGGDQLYSILPFGDVSDPELLPTSLIFQNVYVRVTNGSSERDDYWLKYDHYEGKVWKEEVYPYNINKYEAWTMPCTLVRTGDTTFDLTQGSWKERQVGDEVTSPEPSFIGLPIEDIGTFKNRLVFLCGDNVILSQAGDYFDFWRKSVLTIVDSDPIDTPVPGSSVTYLRKLTPFDESLILWGDEHQFILRGDEVLGPKTSEVKESSAYRVNTGVAPVSVNDRVLYLENSSSDGVQGTNIVREYFRADNNDNYVSTPTSRHVPRLIPADATNILASGNNAFIYARNGSTFYVNQWLDSGEGKLQNAWHEWDVSSYCQKILGAHLYLNTLYVVGETQGVVSLFKIDLTPGLYETGLDYRPILNLFFRASPGNYPAGSTVVYDGIADETTLTFPVPISDTNTYAVYAGDHSETDIRGLAESAEATASTGSIELVMSGDHTASSFIIGTKEEGSFTFSKFIRRTNEGIAVNNGRLQLRKAYLNYDACGPFDAVVSYDARAADATYRMSGVIVANPGGWSQSQLATTGRFAIPLMAHNENVSVTITNTSFAPLRFTSMDWEGMWHPRKHQQR